MDDSIRFMDGVVDSPPIVISRELFERIRRIAARANMEAADLIGLALIDVFNDPELSLEKLAQLIRELPEEG